MAVSLKPTTITLLHATSIASILFEYGDYETTGWINYSFAPYITVLVLNTYKILLFQEENPTR